MKREDLKLLNLLSSLPLVAQRLEPELQDTAVQKRFRGNVHLLMGLRNIPGCEVAKLAGIDYSTFSRILNPKPNTKQRFEKVNILTFVSIAKVLGVSIHTLLFVNLGEKLLQTIEDAENKNDIGG